MPKYKVCGTAAVLEHAPGKTFTADLDSVQEQRLLDGGAIKRVGGDGRPAPEKPELSLSEVRKLAAEAGVPDAEKLGSLKAAATALRDTPTEEAQALARQLSDDKE